jgi:hypothetical protein
MFDHVTCEVPMPDGRELARDSFQTKSLHCLMDLFTITAAGRLVYHQRRYYPTSDTNPRMPEPVADVDMNYHGDIELYSTTNDGTLATYVARFTHGTLEWIRPLVALGEIDRFLPMNKG